MRILGHKTIRKALLKKARSGNLAGSFIFFGESQIGKLLVAKEIASALEARPATPTETLVISPSEEERTIGIDEARRIRKFFSLKAVSSSVRMVIVNDADALTAQAQHALLKVAEEPPSAALLVLVLQNPASLLGTLQSRFQKIYFSRASAQSIEDWLVEERGIERGRAAEIARASFGKPGRALELADALEHPPAEKPDALETSEDYARFIAKSVAKLYHEDRMANAPALRRLLVCLARIESLNVNKKMQLQAALWNNS